MPWGRLRLPKLRTQMPRKRRAGRLTPTQERATLIEVRRRAQPTKWDAMFQLERRFGGTVANLPDIMLVRGLPGSGKSTGAAAYARNTGAKVYEADQYFVGDDGVYRFDPSRIRDAHAWCMASTFAHVSKGGRVIVANTFTQIWEMKPYVDFARENGYTLEVWRALGDWPNIHGVPDDVIRRMNDRWEHIDRNSFS